MVDIASRVYNHTWKIDPIVRSVLDTDFYKLLMAQTIFRRHRDVAVTFGIQNRTTRVRLAEIVDAGELREQLDHVRSLSLTRGESTWLRGNTFYGKRQMFSPEFMDWLETFRFPEYLLEKRDGQYVLTFHGPWIETTMWEIPALAILNELRSRGVTKGMGKHELPMVYAALADTDAALARAPYEVLADWQEEYEGNLRVILPDTYGTTNFLKHAPPWVAAWTGIRIDSKDPLVGGEEAIDWWLSRGQDPGSKLAIFSDGLDVEAIEAIHRQFRGRMRLGYGWGTLLTNDFRGLAPEGALVPISVVCKVISANGRPTVKLSDNPTKAIG